MEEQSEPEPKLEYPIIVELKIVKMILDRDTFLDGLEPEETNGKV